MAREPHASPWESGVAALLTRLLKQPLEATQLAVLQEQLLRQGAERQDQLPELLLRSPLSASCG